MSKNDTNIMKEDLLYVAYLTIMCVVLGIIGVSMA